MNQFFAVNFENSVALVALYWLVVLALAIIATNQILSRYTGIEVPVWLILIWMLPVIGPILTFFYHRQPKITSGKELMWQEFYQQEPHRKYLSEEEQKVEFNKWSRDRE